jgi:DNA primase
VIDKIEDVRTAKREYVIGRAKELLRRLSEDVPEVQQLTEALKEDVRVAEISSWKGLPSGPNLESNDEVIIVEGRADVLTLLRNGIKNSVAIEGTSVPPAIAELSKQKITTAFMDGDRGGDLIIKELFATCDLDFVCRAPRGKEVEELTKKELFKALRERVTGDQARAELGANGRGSEDKRSERAEVREHMESRRVATAPPETREREEPEEHMPEPVRRVRGPAIEKAQAERYRTLLEELTGTRAAYLLNEDGQIIGKLPVRELASALREVPAETIAFDGEADQRLLNMAAAKGVKVVVAMRAAVRNVPETVTLVTLADL